jgi:hypothetical protein
MADPVVHIVIMPAVHELVFRNVPVPPPLVAYRGQKRLDEVDHARGFRTASSTTPFFGCAVAISARVAATSSAASRGGGSRAVKVMGKPAQTSCAQLSA